MGNCYYCGGVGSVSVPFIYRKNGLAYQKIMACGFCPGGKRCHPSYPVLGEPLPFPRDSADMTYQETLLKRFSNMTEKIAKEKFLFDNPPPPPREKPLDISSLPYPDDLKAPAFDVYVMTCDKTISPEDGAQWLLHEILTRGLTIPKGLEPLAGEADPDSLAFTNHKIWKKVKEFNGLWKGKHEPTREELPF